MSKTYTLSLTRKTAVQATPEVLALSNAFGIGTDEEHELKFYSDLPITLAPGRIVYIHGDSGSGKSSLMRQLRDHAIPDWDVIDTGPGMRAPPMPTGMPLISMFGMPVRDAAALLAIAGLGEPFVMCRKPEELSDGQHYRLGIAWAIHACLGGKVPAQAGKSDKAGYVLFLDEFLAVLDRNLAKAVASNLRRAVDKYGICAVVATTHDDIKADLDPDATVRLRLNRPPWVAPGRSVEV